MNLPDSGSTKHLKLQRIGTDTLASQSQVPPESDAANKGIRNSYFEFKKNDVLIQ